MATDDHQRPRPIVGMLCVVAGIGGLLQPFWTAPSGATPFIVSLLSGAIFLVSGVVICSRPQMRLAQLAAAVIFLCLAIMGAWMLLFAPETYFAETATAPTRTDVAIGRTAGGIGAVLGLVGSICLLYQLMRRSK